LIPAQIHHSVATPAPPTPLDESSIRERPPRFVPYIHSTEDMWGLLGGLIRTSRQRALIADTVRLSGLNGPRPTKNWHAIRKWWQRDTQFLSTRWQGLTRKSVLDYLKK